MTEEQWANGDDVEALLAYLQQRRYHVRKTGRRKLRLFACACCRRFWDILDETRRAQVERAERIADDPGAASLNLTEMLQAYSGLGVPGSDHRAHQMRCAAFCAMEPTIMAAVRGASGSVLNAITWGQPDARLIAMAERREQCDLLRDIFGNPFQEAKLTRSILKANGSAVAGLAREIYEEGAFDRLPILGDALEDAGCADERILAHCRESGTTHVRGCWVVDLALGKA